MSGYSTLKSGPGPATGRDQENLDYETLSRSGIVSEEELEKWVHSRAGNEPLRSLTITEKAPTVEGQGLLLVESAFESFHI